MKKYIFFNSQRPLWLHNQRRPHLPTPSRDPHSTYRYTNNIKKIYSFVFFPVIELTEMLLCFLLSDEERFAAEPTTSRPPEAGLYLRGESPGAEKQQRLPFPNPLPREGTLLWNCSETSKRGRQTVLQALCVCVCRSGETFSWTWTNSKCTKMLHQSNWRHKQNGWQTSLRD